MEQETPSTAPLSQEPYFVSGGSIVSSNPEVQGSPINPKPKFFKRKKFWFILVGVVLLIIILAGTGGYIVFAQGKTKLGQNFQDSVWKDIINSSSTTKSVDGAFSISYQDKGSYEFVPSKFIQAIGLNAGIPTDQLQAYDSQYSFNISNLSYSNTFSGLINIINDSNPQIDLTSSSDFKNNGKNYSFSAGIKQLSKDTYLKYNYNQAIADSPVYKLVTGLSTFDFNTNKNQWLKTTTLPSALPTETTTQTAEQKQSLSILENNRPYDIQKFEGFASINGHETLHYKLILNKANIRSIYEQSLKATNPQITQSDIDSVMQYFDIVMSKTNVQDFEIWVGVRDHKIYKFYYQANTISLAGALNKLESSATNITKSSAVVSNVNDTQRLADFREMQTALDLYEADNDGYPASSQGIPVGLAPKYIGKIPIAPTPPDGSCNTFYNNYWYTALGTPKTAKNGAEVYPNYKYTLCIGGLTTGFAPGVIEGSPEGGFSDAEDTAKLPASTNLNTTTAATQSDPKALVLSILQSLPFDGQITIQESANSFGSNNQVQPPTEFKDMSATTPTATQ